ncbi:TonB-dependent receptor [Zoogloeaceae bacterium G21618-S1]|nr:TonB-dependent receptor [Zoogloeaceae bacterium G21618-S1]
MFLAFGLTLLWPATGAVASAIDAFFEDIPLVLTASRLAQSPMLAPAPVTLIDREMIEASGFTEIHDLLRLVPGFQVADWPGGSPTVANHGIGDAYDRRIKVLVDGRTVNNPIWGDTQWDNLAIRVDDIERIEVVRSANGGAYGANAFQGVVNIITRSPVTEDGYSVISRFGVDGFYDHGVRVNGPEDSPVAWRLSASTRSAATFESFVRSNGENEMQEAFSREVLNLQLVSQINPQDRLSLHFGVSQGVDNRGYPEMGTRLRNFQLDPVQDGVIRNQTVHAAWTRSYSTTSELSLQYFYQGQQARRAWEIDVRKVGEARDGTIFADRDIDVSVNNLEVQLSGQILPSVEALIGAGARHERVRSAAYFDTDAALTATYWQTFGNLTWQATDAMALNLGGTYEHHDYSGKLFSPRVAINYALTPTAGLRVSAGKAYRAPSLIEAHGLETLREDGSIVNIGYNAAQPVDPEEMRFFEIGLVARPMKGLSVDVRVFREAYSGYLDSQSCRLPTAAVPVPSKERCSDVGVFPPADWSAANALTYQSAKTKRFLNLGNFVAKGGEYTVDWRRKGWGRVVFSQAYITLNASDDLVDRDIELSAPQVTTSLLFMKDLPERWRASLGYYHNDDMYWLNQGDRVPNRDRIDLRLAKRFGPPGAENEFALVMQNLGEIATEFHEGRYRHEPLIYASLRLVW